LNKENLKKRIEVSLKHYLFLLIGTLILVFSAIQYYFIEEVRVQVNEEITDKTRTLSQVALNAVGENMPIRIDRVSELVREPNESGGDTFQEVLITENIVGAQQQISNEQLGIIKAWQAQQKPSNESGRVQNLEADSPNRIRIKIEDTPNKEIQLDPKLTMVTGENTKTVSISRQAPLLATDNENEVMASFTATEGLDNGAPIKAVLVNRVNSGYTVDFEFGDDELNFQKIVSFDSGASTVNRYFSQLRWQLLVFTLVGLLLAYFLARHISRPLSNLSQGFKDLGDGDLGVQLPITGVEEIRKTIKVFNQTSERLAQLQTLEKSYQQQQQMAELGEVARGLAHTLRNPLNTIGLGISQMQSVGVSKQEQTKIAQQIQAKISHVDETIKNLMSLANTDIKRSKSVNVMAVVSDIMLEMSIAKHDGIKWLVEDSSKACYLKSAEAELRAMFHALISNAVEASAEHLDKPNLGQNEKLIRIKVESTDTGICLSVHDSGSGLSSDDIDNLFKPHFTTKSEGAGMGLFIVKRICEMYYQGSISLHNIDSGGCEAKLILNHALQDTRTQQ
jgi:signal transduction histidine kinase